MSRKSVLTKMPCPNCGKPMNFKIKSEIEIPDDMVYKTKIMKNKLFNMQCKDCNIFIPSSYRLTYNDMDQHYLIWVMPQLTDKEKKEILDYNQRLKTDRALQLARNDYRFRVVRDDKQLKEKIIIFDEGLDDRVLEIMKLSYIPVIREEMKITGDILGFYFTKSPKDGSYQWLIFIKDSRPLVAPVDMEKYENLKEDLQELLDARTAYGMTFINPPWAIDTMRIRMNAGPSTEKIDVEEAMRKEKERVQALMEEAKAKLEEQQQEE